MGVFDRFERRLERLVEGAFGRVFKGEAAPADIALALQRETDDRKVIVGPGRIIAPNTFVVALGDHDHARLGPYAESLDEAFGEMLTDHARAAGYSFAGPLSVSLEHDPALDTGRFLLRSEPARAAGARTPVPATAPAPVPAAPAPVAAAAAPPAPAPPPPAPPPPAPQVAALPPVAEATITVRHRIVIRGDVPGEDVVVPLLTPVTVLGRSAGADVRLEDPGVSRRHAELHLVDGAVRLLDAGSTNGTTVNDEPVTSRQLRSGDRIQLGGTVVVYRATE